MARDYQDDYGSGDYRSLQENQGFFDRIGDKISNAWERIRGDEDDQRPSRSAHYPYSGESDRGGYRSSAYGSGNSGSHEQDTRYGQSQMGRYSPQRSEGSRYGGTYRSGQDWSSSGYSGRMSDYGSSSRQHGQSQGGGGYGSSQGYGHTSSQGSGYGQSGSPYGAGASGGEYGASGQANYGSTQRDYGSSSGYGRSSMGFPRGSDYGSGGSGSMGGGYFGSGAGPWSGGPYGETGTAGYKADSGSQRGIGGSSGLSQQGRSGHMGSAGGYSSSDYDYSRREQWRRGHPDQSHGSDRDR